jgi:transposase
MRSEDVHQGALFSYVDLEEDRVPSNNSLRRMKLLVDGILRSMLAAFDTRYTRSGRHSVQPERLLRALLLQVLFTIRSEGQLMEQLNYNLLHS